MEWDYIAKVEIVEVVSSFSFSEHLLCLDSGSSHGKFMWAEVIILILFPAVALIYVLGWP